VENIPQIFAFKTVNNSTSSVLPLLAGHEITERIITFIIMYRNNVYINSSTFGNFQRLGHVKQTLDTPQLEHSHVKLSYDLI
jgi:hypothetical protein